MVMASVIYYLPNLTWNSPRMANPWFELFSLEPCLWDLPGHSFTLSRILSLIFFFFLSY